MCLNTVYNSKKKKEELAKLPDMVKCWKVVRRHSKDQEYWPPIYDFDAYDVGWNEVKPRNCFVGYRVAFHAFLSKREAQKWLNVGRDQKVVQSKTEKTDIVAIGLLNNRKCIVTKRIWIPKPKKKTA